VLVNILISVFLFIAINILWQLGGQINKAARRYGIPITAGLAILFVKIKEKRPLKEKLALICLLPAIGILSMGYGQDSWLRKVCGGSDTLTRIVYAILLSIPILAVYLIAGYSLIFWGVGLILLVGAFQVRAGVWFKWLGGKDWLIEDTFRASAFAINMIFLLWLKAWLI